MDQKTYKYMSLNCFLHLITVIDTIKGDGDANA